MRNKEELFKWIKTERLLCSLPLVLALGPIAGYFFGDYLRNKFRMNSYIVFIFIAVGFVFSLIETVKIIMSVGGVKRSSKVNK